MPQAVTALPMLTPELVEVRLMMLAVTGAETVSIPEADRFAVPMQPPAHCRAPVTVREPLGTERENVEPLPADEAPRETIPPEDATTLTFPVELAVIVVADVDGTEIPPEPEFIERDGVVSVDVVIAPVPPVFAVREIDDEAVIGLLRVMFPAVELRLTFGDVNADRPVSVMVSAEVTVTVPEAPVPVIVPPRFTPAVVEVRLMASAAIVAELLSAFLLWRDSVPMFPEAA